MIVKLSFYWKKALLLGYGLCTAFTMSLVMCWSSHTLLTLGLLEEVVAPVGQVEHSKDCRKCDAADDINFLGPWRELVEPGLEEVVISLRLHVDLTVVKLVHHGVMCSLTPTGWGWRRRRRTIISPHHGLLETNMKLKCGQSTAKEIKMYYTYH